MNFLINLLAEGGAPAGGAGPTSGITPGNPLIGLTAAKGALSDKPLALVVSGVINAALGIVGVLLLALIVYGGFIWMTAQGDEKKVEKATGIIKDAVIGLIIVLAAYAISFFVTEALVKATATTTP